MNINILIISMKEFNPFEDSKYNEYISSILTSDSVKKSTMMEVHGTIEKVLMSCVQMVKSYCYFVTNDV
jgi:hypothetical protein